MALSYKILRKRLIKEAIILGVSLVAAIVLGVILMYQNDDTLLEKQTMDGDVGQARNRLTELRNELNSGQEQVRLFELYTKSHNQNFSLNREEVTKWFAAQREKFHIVNLSITIPPFSETPKDSYPLKSGPLIRTEIRLSFGALTDNSVFAFIEELQRAMPGFAIIQDVRITRTADISSGVLLALNKHRITPIVTVEMTVAWLGIREDVKEKGKTNAK